MILVRKAAITLCAAAFFAGCAGGAKEGQEFVLVNGTEIQSIDPTQVQGVPEHRVSLALFEELVRNDPQTSAAVPGVAESWTLNEDGSVITFKIRKDAVWSDGTPITAQTFVDSWLYHLNPETADEYAYMPGMVIKGADAYNTGTGSPEDVAIRALDPLTFEVTLVGSVPYALDMMAHYAFAPLPMHVLEKYGRDWIKKENFVCNGPFVLKEWIPNDRLVVVANDKYWNKSNVFLNQITFLPIEDTNTAYQAYKAGEVDWVYNVPLALLDELKLDKNFHTASQAGTYYYSVKTTHPILQDARIRKALSMALNRQELIDSVTKGGQIPAFALAPPMGGYEPATGTGYDVAEAQRLLAEAGYPEGKGLPVFTVIYNTLDSHRVIAEYIQAQWKENLGVNITLQNLEWATFLDERRSSRMEIARNGWISDYSDVQNFLDLLVSGTGNNDGKYSNPEYDRLIRQAAAMPGGAERNAVMRQAEEIAITQDQAVIPIYYYVSQHLIDLDKWSGWYENALDIHPWIGIKRK
ncbi:MAG: peptide ABC transporter substrate-binding protein [Spirochaetaceae bacterium]|jgi:oligopeptide transport system substrate-binding protein|nr:peptide ABC transporter substrate-binding protein [Spirochaetaceae bacterium]